MWRHRTLNHSAFLSDKPCEVLKHSPYIRSENLILMNVLLLRILVKKSLFELKLNFSK